MKYFLIDPIDNHFGFDRPSMSLLIICRAAHVQVNFDECGDFPNFHIYSPQFDPEDSENCIKNFVGAL